MTIINGSLFEDIVKFHKPEHKANTAAIVIDEMDKKSGFETVKNWGIRKQNQEETLLFCKKIGCKIIVVHEESYSRPKHIYGSIGEPDFSCIKHDSGVLEQRTNPPLLPYLIKNEITSLVLMGGRYDMCVRACLIGQSCFGSKYPGLLNCQFTVLTSPSLLYSYEPELYDSGNKFSLSATYFSYEKVEYMDEDCWPIFALFRGMRFYTKIHE